MDRTQTDKLLERILSSRCRVVVLHGPAGAGKTSAALAMVRHFADGDGQGQCLLVAPNAPAVAAGRRALLAGAPSGVLVAPQVGTFAALAERILAAAGDRSRTLSPFQRSLLLQRIVAEMASAGQFRALGAVADTPGLIAVLDRAISEFKRAAVEPDALANVIDKRQAKLRDLLEVYRRFQQHLQATDTYDVEGRMWLARDTLAALPDRSPAPGLEDIRALAVDGFTDFTPTQLKILSLLSRSLKRVLITLPLADDGRARLWHWTHRTLNNIRRAFGDEMEQLPVVPAAEKTVSPPLRTLWRNVFDMDAGRCEAPAGLEIISAAGVEAEVAAVARRVKRLLVEGAPAGSIAVLARSMESYRPAIERIFARHDIPVAPGPLALTDVPIVRFVLDAAALGPEFAFADVLRVIKNSYFRPQALGGFDAATAATAEMLIREANVLGGRRAYADAAERLARAPAGHEGDEHQDEEIPLGPLPASPKTLSDAVEMLEKLFKLVETAAGEKLNVLIDGLNLRSAALAHADESLIARDLRGLETLEQALSGLDWPGLPADRLRPALAAIRCAPARSESLVDVMDVLDARALRYEHVFLLGAGEGQFPGRFTEGALLSESDRSAFSGRGVVLDSRRDLTAREMLLFYLAVSRCDATLTLSYMESDAAGRPAAPSSFLLSLIKPVGGLEAAEQAGILKRIPRGAFLPPPEALASRSDAFNAAVAGLFGDDWRRWHGAAGWAAEQAGEKIARAATGLWAHHRRWLAGEYDEFDGRITNAELLGGLARRYPGEEVFSASRLNAFGQCPWLFFATYVLNLKPLRLPQRRLEPIFRGVFCHNVLFRVMNRLRGELGGSVILAETDPQRLAAALDEAVAAESEQVESRRPQYPVLWRIQREQMQRELKQYLDGQRQPEDFAAESLYFELGFGMDESEQELTDPAGSAKPITISTPAGEVRLRGKIDRVDRLDFAGGEKLFVIDYKTGRPARHKDIDAGRNLQLPLYVEAVEQLGGKPSAGGAFHYIADGKQLHFSTVRTPPKEKRTFEQRRIDALKLVGDFVSRMGRGRFDLLPTDKCPSYCPFRRICHYAESRAGRKAHAAEEGAE